MTESLDAVRDAYVQFCTHRNNTGLRDVERSIERTQQELQETRQRLVTLSRQMESLTIEQKALKAGEVDRTDAFASEFNALMAMPNVKRVSCPSQDVVTIYTNLLYCTHPGTKEVRELGEFEIRFHCSGNDQGNVRFNNLTRGGGNRHHPHIGSYTCWGNAGHEVTEYLAQYQIRPAFLKVLQFLQTFNPGDTLISFWSDMPVVPEEAVIRLGLRDVAA